MLNGSRCGVLLEKDIYLPKDTHGCHLDITHEGPHEFVSEDNKIVQWCNDESCDCECCLSGEDSCVIFWEVEN